MAISVNTKLFKGAPFGVQATRFDVSGVNPKNKSPGTFTEVSFDKKSNDELVRKMGPGMYHLDCGGFHPQAVEQRALGPGWARQHELERLAALPYLLNKELWEERHSMKHKLGPGSYNMPDFVDAIQNKPRSNRGVCDSLAQRFEKGFHMTTPGPGTYGKGGVPFAALEEKKRRPTSTKGMLDSKSTARSHQTVGCSLGPGTYNFKSMADDILTRKISTRGPYDVFTADRNKPISVGHFAAPKLANLGPGQYNIKPLLTEWSDEHHYKKGKFGKVAQYPQPPSDRTYNSCLAQFPREQGLPGPGKYYPGELTKPSNHKQPGFLSFAERMDRRAQRFFTGNFV